MRRTLHVLVILGFAATPAMAQKQMAKGTPGASTREAATPAGKDSTLDRELQQLRLLLESQARELRLNRSELEAQRDLLREQQLKIEAMERRFEQQAANPPAAAPGVNEKAGEVELLDGQLGGVADSQKELSKRVAKVQGDLADTKKIPDPKAGQSVASGFGSIKFNGLLQAWYAGGNGGSRDTFRLRRTELKFSGKITPRAAWTIMLDPAKALSLNNTFTSINGTPVLTNTSPNQASRVLQDAFISLDYLKNVHIDFGQFKIPISLEGLQSSAKLDTVERALFVSDRGRGGSFGDIRELGLMISGPITSYVSYQVGLFNGSGETQNDVARNDQKATIGRLVVHPLFLKGLQIGGSGAFGNGGSRPDRARRDRLGAEAQFVRGSLTLKWEWMEGKDGDALRQGYYGHIGFKIRGLIEPIFRFDAFDPNVNKETSAADVLERDYIVGFNYYVTEHNWKVQFNYVRKTFANNFIPSRNSVLVNLQTSW